MEENRSYVDAGYEKNQRKILELMDVLCETGVALEAISRMCSVLKLGFESPDFCDGKDAAACTWVIEQLLDWIHNEKVSPYIYEK